MFEKLCEIYPDFKYALDRKPQLKSIAQVFYIEDKVNCSAHFVISSLLDFYLKNNDSAIFVGLQQNYAHYYSISKRMGNSLDPHIKSESLTYIDFFTSLTDWVPEDLPLTEEGTIFWNPLPPKAIKMKIESDQGEALMNSLYETIVSNLEKKKDTKTKGNCGIIIDNLAVFLTLGVSVKSIVTFYNKIYELVLRNEKKPSFYFILTKETLDQEQSKLTLLFQKNCDYMFKVFQNPSGYSQDVHGQLEAVCNNNDSAVPFTFKFKLYENKIELFKYLSG